MARESNIFSRDLHADAIAEKRKLFPMVMGWVWCRISFMLIRSAIMAIRGSTKVV